MKAIGIILILTLIQINTKNPVFIFDLNREYNAIDDTESYKYITKSNLSEIETEQVKNLRFNKTKCRKIPDEIKTFRHVEELDLSTEQKGMHVRWMNGLCEFISYHEKGKLKKLPNWLLEFKNLEKIHLAGQLELNIGESIELLQEIKGLEEITVEVDAKEISDLEKIQKIGNLKIIRIQKEDLIKIEREKIEEIFADKKIEYELESVNRKRFKK